MNIVAPDAYHARVVSYHRGAVEGHRRAERGQAGSRRGRAAGDEEQRGWNVYQRVWNGGQDGARVYQRVWNGGQRGANVYQRVRIRGQRGSNGGQLGSTRYHPGATATRRGTDAYQFAREADPAAPPLERRGAQANRPGSGVDCRAGDMSRAWPTLHMPEVTSINVGQVREVSWRGRRIRTGIWKTPIDGASVMVRGVNLDGDDQADRRVHGGPDKAVYAYAEEDYVFWREVEGLAVAPGLFGENLTVRGVELRDAVVGERWRLGSAVLEVAQPRLPCYKLGIRMGDDEFPGRFEAAGRMGAYLRIINEGVVAPGDRIEVVSRPSHGVTLGKMIEAIGDPERLRGLLRAKELPRYRRELAERG